MGAKGEGVGERHPAAERATRRAAPPRHAGGRDVYVYFDNDAKVHAPFDAIALAKLLGLGGDAPERAINRPGKGD